MAAAGHQHGGEGSIPAPISSGQRRAWITGTLDRQQGTGPRAEGGSRASRAPGAGPIGSRSSGSITVTGREQQGGPGIGFRLTRYSTAGHLGALTI